MYKELLKIGALSSKDFSGKSHTLKSKLGKTGQSETSLETLASLGNMDNQTFNKTLYAENYNYCEDNDVEAIYQGYDDEGGDMRSVLSSNVLTVKYGNIQCNDMS